MGGLRIRGPAPERLPLSMSAYRPYPAPVLRPAQPAGFGIEDFIAILQKRRWLIVKVAAAVVVAATLYAFSQPTIYSASAVVMLDGRSGGGGGGEVGFGGGAREQPASFQRDELDDEIPF